MDSKLITRLRNYSNEKLQELLLHPETHQPRLVDAAWIVVVERGIMGEIIPHLDQHHDHEENHELPLSASASEKYNRHNVLSLTPGSYEQMAFEEALVQNGITYHRHDLSVPIVRYYFQDEDMVQANAIYHRILSRRYRPNRHLLQKLDDVAPQWITRVGFATVALFVFVLLLTLFFN